MRFDPKIPLPWEARGTTVLHRLPGEGDNVLLVAKCHSEQDAEFIVAVANARHFNPRPDRE